MQPIRRKPFPIRDNGILIEIPFSDSKDRLWWSQDRKEVNELGGGNLRSRITQIFRRHCGLFPLDLAFPDLHEHHEAAGRCDPAPEHAKIAY